MSAVPENAIDVVFQDGSFRPLTEVSFADGTPAKVVLIENEFVVKNGVKIPTRYADSFGIMSDEDAAEILKIVEEEFGTVDPNDWK